MKQMNILSVRPILILLKDNNEHCFWLSLTLGSSGSLSPDFINSKNTVYIAALFNIQMNEKTLTKT